MKYILAKDAKHCPRLEQVGNIDVTGSACILTMVIRCWKFRNHLFLNEGNIMQTRKQLIALNSALVQRIAACNPESRKGLKAKLAASRKEAEDLKAQNAKLRAASSAPSEGNANV